MVSAYEKATRLNLKVKIKAPIIIVPIDSQSMKALCLDLGLIKVSNHFSDHFVNERNAVIDEMKLELSDFKLFHAGIVPPTAGDQDDTDGNVYQDKSCLNIYLFLTHNIYIDIAIIPASNYILVPTSFTLNILRNLSATWYTERPDLEVFGKINAINVSVLSKHGNKLFINFN